MSTTVGATTSDEGVAARISEAVDDRRRVRQALVAIDLAAAGLGVAAVVAAAGFAGGASTGLTAVLITAAAAGLAVARHRGSGEGHGTGVRSTEIARAARAALAAGAAALLIDRLAGVAVPTAAAAGLAAALLVALVVGRSAHRTWVTLQRSEGRLVERAVIVGTGRGAVELVHLAEVHPEAGTRVVGLVGSRVEAEAAGLGHLWLGEVADLLQIVDGGRVAADRIVVSTDELDARDLATLLEREQQGGAQVLVHAGLPGIDARRVSVSAVANEVLLRITPSSPSPASRAVTRTLDIVIAAAVLAVAAPVMAVVALLVKREDGGPVLFRQERVGRDGARFEMLKFRTMVTDAEARLAAVEGDNQRSGPLFKLAVDPRVTRIGHVLRRTSLDELPQLLNVLAGDMSLVGPRPALPREVDEFPADLHARHRVRPGITGLWQVEARDNPAFAAYRRLDLFYVDNRSVAMDLAILVATAEQMVLRPFLSRRRGELAATQAPAETPAFVTAA